jgi:hypothetical protein
LPARAGEGDASEDQLPQQVPHFYVFGSEMKHWIFRYAYGTGAITKKWDLGALLTKVSQRV